MEQGGTLNIKNLIKIMDYTKESILKCTFLDDMNFKYTLDFTDQYNDYVYRVVISKTPQIFDGVYNYFTTIHNTGTKTRITSTYITLDKIKNIDSFIEFITNEIG
jgi:hypothetical protein